MVDACGLQVSGSLDFGVQPLRELPQAPATAGGAAAAAGGVGGVSPLHAVRAGALLVRELVITNNGTRTAWVLNACALPAFSSATALSCSATGAGGFSAVGAFAGCAEQPATVQAAARTALEAARQRQQQREAEAAAAAGGSRVAWPDEGELPGAVPAALQPGGDGTAGGGGSRGSGSSRGRAPEGNEDEHAPLALRLAPGQEHRLAVAVCVAKGPWGPPASETGVLGQWLLLTVAFEGPGGVQVGSLAGRVWLVFVGCLAGVWRVFGGYMDRAVHCIAVCNGGASRSSC